MIINQDPDYERKKAAQERLNRSEEEVKEELLNKLREESTSIISLACIYAKKLEETGIDITERWETAERQAEILREFFNRGYRKGLVDGISKGKEIERAEAKQIQEQKHLWGGEFVGGSLNPGEMRETVRKIARRNPTKKKRKR